LTQGKASGLPSDNRIKLSGTVGRGKQEEVGPLVALGLFGNAAHSEEIVNELAWSQACCEVVAMGFHGALLVTDPSLFVPACILYEQARTVKR